MSKTILKVPRFCDKEFFIKIQEHLYTVLGKENVHDPKKRITPQWAHDKNILLSYTINKKVFASDPVIIKLKSGIFNFNYNYSFNENEYKTLQCLIYSENPFKTDEILNLFPDEVLGINKKQYTLKAPKIVTDFSENKKILYSPRCDEKSVEKYFIVIEYTDYKESEITKPEDVTPELIMNLPEFKNLAPLVLSSSDQQIRNLTFIFLLPTLYFKNANIYNSFTFSLYDSVEDMPEKEYVPEKSKRGFALYKTGYIRYYSDIRNQMNNDIRLTPFTGPDSTFNSNIIDEWKKALTQIKIKYDKLIDKESIEITDYDDLLEFKLKSTLSKYITDINKHSDFDKKKKILHNFLSDISCVRKSDRNQIIEKLLASNEKFKPSSFIIKYFTSSILQFDTYDYEHVLTIITLNDFEELVKNEPKFSKVNFYGSLLTEKIPSMELHDYIYATKYLEAKLKMEMFIKYPDSTPEHFLKTGYKTIDRKQFLELYDSLPEERKTSLGKYNMLNKHKNVV